MLKFIRLTAQHSKQETRGLLTKESLIIKKYPEVFNEGVGKLTGEHHISINQQLTQSSMYLAACQLRYNRVKVKEALEEHKKQDIELSPSSWISSMVIVPKKNGKIRMCLDSRDLNKAIQ